jgi:fructose-1,6-bisphosphatase I
VGSIFGITRRAAAAVGAPATFAEALRPGAELTAAGYCVYGPSTQLVLAFQGDVVNVFTLDPAIGEFILSQPALRIPAAPQRIYSMNEGNVASFPRYVQRFAEAAKIGAKPYSLRYTGSMVADVHRTLLYGGVFLYPATAAAPDGKLRLLYECAPMALLMEAAGGRAVAVGEKSRILDIVPAAPHAKSPIILGCARDVDHLCALAGDWQGGGAAPA